MTRSHRFTQLLAGLLLLGLLILGLSAFIRALPARAATVPSMWVYCDRTLVAGKVEVPAPYVRVTVNLGSDLSVQLGQTDVPVFADGSYRAALDYPLQSDHTSLMVSVGEWDGSQFLRPATMLNNNCGPTAPISQTWLYCNGAVVTGNVEVPAPYVRVTLNLASDLTKQLDQVIAPVQPDGSYQAALRYLLISEDERVIISVGEWDGSQLVRPAHMYGMYCQGTAPVPQTRLYCDGAVMTGQLDMPAQYVRVTLNLASDLTNQLGQIIVPVKPDGSYEADLRYPYQPEDTRIIISAGEWDGSQLMRPALMYGMNCQGTAPPVTSETLAVPGTVHDANSFDILVKSCANATSATFTITTPGGQVYPPDQSWPNVLQENPANSGTYVATVPPLEQLNMQGIAEVKATIDCGGELREASASTFIDPSGRITDSQGNPIAGVGVTLLYQPSGDLNEPFQPVPDQNAGLPAPIMSDANKNNPTTTDALGFYRWDVSPGWYKVRALKEGCGSPVESAAVAIVQGGSPATDIDLILDCGNPGLAVQLASMGDWQTGYCRNVIITNGSDQPVDWKITFVTEGAITNFWNVHWTQSRQQVTAEGVSWNNILQPGKSTDSIGFCASRSPGPDPTPTPSMPSDVSASVAIQSDWGAGYCADVIVTNNTSAPADWKVTFDVAGSIASFWSAIWSQNGAEVTAEGTSWNNILQPGQSTQIGFCANR